MGHDGHHYEVNDHEWDTGVLTRFAVDDDGVGFGCIKAQHSERRYIVLHDELSAVRSTMEDCDWDQLYEFNPWWDEKKEMWIAQNIQYYYEEEGDDAHDDDAVGGVVTRYFEDRGFGFIEADDSGATPSADEYFFHISQVDGDSIAEGDWVYFYESFDDAKDRYYATDVIVANDEKEE